jgi:hypothetical protein
VSGIGGEPAPGLPTASELRWTIDGGAPWPALDRVISVAIDFLPSVEDDLTAEVLLATTLALVDAREELRAIRAVGTGALTLCHQLQDDLRRVRQRNRELLDQCRQLRRDHACQPL